MTLATISDALRSDGVEPAAARARLFAEWVEDLREIAGLSLADYAALVASDDAARRRLATALLTKETPFFADPASLAFVGRLAVSRTADAGGSARVLVVATGTGEEAYSAMIAMLEAGVRAGRIALDAIDPSAAAIERARTGRYPEASVAGLSEEQRARWLLVDEVGWRVRPEVRVPARFAVTSLLAPSPAFVRPPYDVVLCRDVLRRLTPSGRARLLASATRVLSPTGILVLDPAEAPIARDAGLTPCAGALPVYTASKDARAVATHRAAVPDDLRRTAPA